VLLSFALITKAAKIAILESQSVHSLHNMDDNWLSTAASLGHDATIVEQTFLDDYVNFNDYDVILTASGLIEIPDNRKANLLQFIQNGGNVYIQSEYLVDLPGNVTFKYFADNLGSTFNWEGEVTGQLAPMEIIGSIAQGITDGIIMNYFWYGTYGSGDANFEAFLNYDDKSWGFLYCPPTLGYGKIVTTSDQDWVRIDAKNSLMIAILEYLTQPAQNDILPTVSIESTSSECASLYTFTATIENDLSGTELQWLVNGQPIMNETGSIFTTSNISEGDVVECQLFFQDACATYTHVSNPILIAPINPISSPELTITIDNQNFCQGQTATFTTNITQAPDLSTATYQWLINGQIVNDATTSSFASAQLNDTDIISCQLNYIDACGDLAQVLSNAIEVSVLTPLNPSLTITADLTTICEGQAVQFSAFANEAGNNPVYQWQIDGENVGTNSPTFSTTQLANGQNINCLVIPQESCSMTNEANSNTITIAVNDVITPSIEISATATTVCTGQPVTFTASASDFGTNPTFQWYVDGSAIGTNATSFTTSTLTNGQIVTCVLTANEVCYSSNAVSADPISIVVTEDVVPTLVLNPNATNVCPGQTVTVAAGGENHGPNPIFTWTVNGQPLAQNQSSLILDNVLDVQTISCQLVNNDACAASNVINSEVLTISVEALTIEILELANENCSNADGLIEVMASGGSAPYTFEWSNAQGEQLLTDLSAGSYELTVTDALGCTSTAMAEIQDLSGPEIAVIDVIDADCDGRNSQVNITLINNDDEVEITWKNAVGEIVFTGANVQNLTPGTYEIDVTNIAGCVSTETVVIGQSDGVSLTLNDHIRMDLGADTRIETFVNSNDVVFEWFPTEGLSCTDCPNPIANPTETMRYTVTVTNSNGCSTTNEVVVQVVPKEDVFIPNAFSPNGDGINDFFTVYGGSNVASIKNMRVFDRWGTELYGNEDFMPNLEQEGWNGTFKGEVLDMGVYIYFVEVEYIDGSTSVQKGDLSITK
jgi:gliding motility-associated-like protein